MSTFDRVTTVVGDLEHPLYDDEHRRDVWNEAAAVAYQAMSFGLVAVVAALAWLGGPSAGLPIALIAVVLAVPTILATAHAGRRGVDAWHLPGTGPRRVAVLVVLALIAVAGVVVGGLDTAPDLPTGVGLTVGALVGGITGAAAMLAVMWGVMRLARRRAPRGED